MKQIVGIHLKSYIRFVLRDETTQYAFYLQDEVYVSNKLLLIPSVRYDHHDTFGGQASPNIGATYFLSDSSRIKTNYGQSYRAPSVDELYGAYDHMGMFTFYGNPNLEPEETTGWEISYEKEFNDSAKTKLTYFRHEKNNAISYKKLSGNGSMDKPDYQFINIGETSTQGIEFSYEKTLGKGFMLLADYAYLDTKNKTKSERLDYNARSTYTAKLLWTEQTENPWSIVLSNRWYSDYHSEGKDYSINTFNVSVNKKWANKYRAFIGIDNLFDKHNTNINAYGRLWRAGIEFIY